MRAERADVALLIWVCVIVLLVVPWHGFQSHGRWHEIGWVPFGSGRWTAGDAMRNALLYLPFGYLHGIGRAPRTWRTMVFAAAVSGLTELAQVFSHGRYPSATDLVCNTLGAACGRQLAAFGASGRRRA